jgi:pyrimidine operon attenuation protein/uracil phosphoribosyltransferase
MHHCCCSILLNRSLQDSLDYYTLLKSESLKINRAQVYIFASSNLFMKPVTLIDKNQLELIINRLAYQLIENHDEFADAVLLGLQPRGVVLAERIKDRLKQIMPEAEIHLGSLDITFFRDDFRRRDEPLKANSTEIDFIIEDKKVILIDDVLYTGRTIRAGLDAMLSYGRPSGVELLVLVDRRFSRELPIEPTYIGKSVDSIDSQRVKVDFAKNTSNDRVLLFNTELADE